MAICPSCGTDNASDARFCVDCGASLAPRCLSCGRELPGAVRFCPHCGAQVAETGPAEPAEDVRERKLVTVLFADVTGSTSLGERLDPERLRDVLDTFFSAMRSEIEAEEGTVEKYIGDAIMAVFGVPTAHEDDPTRALRAAIGMQRRLREVNAELRSLHDVELAIRIGVNTGEVLASPAPGPGESMVAGDAVNVAARLEQAAEPEQIVASERTAAGARGFTFRPLGSLTLKGKSSPFEAMVLVQEAGVPEPGAVDRGVPGLRAPMVGRDREMALLRSVRERAMSDGRPHLVTVYGEPGVGKSRLAREFLEWAQAQEPAPIVLRGRCLPYGEGVIYWPFAEILKDFAGVLDSDSPDVALTKIRTACAGVVDPGVASKPAKVIAALAYTAGVDDPDVSLRDLEPRGVRHMMHDAWRSFLSALAARAFVVVLIEDIHWADPPLLDLLEELTDRAQGGLLFLCPSRPELAEHRPGWGGGRRNVSGIGLEPLDEAQAQHLVSLLLEIDALPGGVRNRILEHAGGNPFFLEEIVRALIDRGAISQDDGRWRAAPDISGVEIPDTIQGVLAARIDLLAPQEKRALQSASVIGRIFWPTPVELLLADARADLTLLLRNLTDRDLVIERLGSQISEEPEYIFKHILTRDVAYESLPRRDRARAHAVVADWIDRTAGDRREEFAQLLAYHYERAYRGEREDPRGDPDHREYLRIKALEALLDAAREARVRYAIGKAFDLVDAALALAEGPEERSRCLDMRGLVALNDYQGDLSYRSLKEAVDLLLDSGSRDLDAVARLCARLVETPTRWPGSTTSAVPEQEVRHYLDIGLRSAGEADSPPRVRLLASMGFMSFAFGSTRPMSGDEKAAWNDAAEQAADMARRLGRPDLESAALDGLSSLHLDDGNYSDMTPLIERRIRIADELEDPWELGDIYAMAAWHWALLGDYPQALRWAGEGIRATADSAPGVKLHGMAWKAFADFMLGRWDAVMDTWRAGDAMLEGERREEPPYFASNLVGPAALVADARRDPVAERLRRIVTRRRPEIPAGTGSGVLEHYGAWILARGGDTSRALEIIDFEWTKHSSIARPFTDQVIARVLADAEEWDRVPDFASSSRAYAERAGIRSLPPHLDRLEGRAALADGDAATATHLLSSSLRGFEQLGCRWEVAVTQLALAEGLAESGDRAAASESLARATTAFEELSSTADLERAGAVSERLGRP